MSGSEGSMLPTGDMVAARFSPVDYIVFCLMLVASVGIGVYSAVKSRGRESTQDFLLGGRNMSPYPVAISLLGGIFSSISILGNPTEVYYFGAQIMMTTVGVIPGGLFVQQTLLPVLYNLQILSLNEYVEKRFDSHVIRKMASMCHLITRFFYMGIFLYAPSLALATTTGLSVWGSMLTMGIVCTFYITIGGVKAVVYSDVLQTALMFGGVLVVVVICTASGGLFNIWDAAQQGGRLGIFNFDTSPYTRHTFWSTFVLGFYVTVSIMGLSQHCYQRFASVNTLEMAQRLVIPFMVGMIGLWFLFYSSGVVAYALYRDCDPLESGRIEKPDQILPYLVMDKLGHLKGLPGLFVAAVYGGVLSSMSSTGNAIACLVWEDILKPWPYFARMSNTASTAVCKFLSALAGLSGIFLGMLAGQLGNVFHVAFSVSGSIMGPMQGIFIAGICVPWVNAKGVMVGFLAAFSYNFWIVVGKFYRGGGSPAKLPLSVEGCPENILIVANSTMTAILNSTSGLDFVIGSTAFPEDPDARVTLADRLTAANEEEEKTVYDVSYCFLGIGGILITVVVSSIVSLFTGPLRPQDVDPRLVSPTCARIHSWLWGVFGASTDNSGRVDIADGEASIPMFPIHTTNIPPLLPEEKNGP